jgi:hypothetical protein
MEPELFMRVATRVNLAKLVLCQGDVATVVEHHAGRPSQEPGYSLEVFTAVGQTVAVVTVRESQVAPLAANQPFHVRALAPVPG